jgi:hypothetical protein
MSHGHGSRGGSLMQAETGMQTEVVLHSDEVVLHVDRGGFAHSRGGFAHKLRWFFT